MNRPTFDIKYTLKNRISSYLPLCHLLHVEHKMYAETLTTFRNIYTGKLELTDANVLEVAFAAKKYMVDETYNGAVSFLT